LAILQNSFDIEIWEKSMSSSTTRKIDKLVPFADIKSQDHLLHDEIILAFQDILEHSCFVLGPYVEQFETAFARATGTKHCVGVNSGTSALHLALICAGVERGHEVITVPMTFIATAWAIRYVNATPVFVDVDPKTFTMDVNQVEAKITNRTKAILPVHLYGQPADLAPLQAIAERHGLALIEDAAQAAGATYFDRSVGSFGQCGCFSFYPGKNLGAYGEAGAVVTNDDAIAKRVRALRDHAQSERYHHQELGFNYRMDAIQGAVLGAKLNLLEYWTDRRRQIAERYNEQLSGLPLRLPKESPERQHAWHLYVALHPERDRIRSALARRDILTGMHYPVPLHLQNAFNDLGYKRGDFPVAERVANEGFSLPMFPDLSLSQQDLVVDALYETCREPIEFQI
jgi:dTDP-4-amino-4,6-dideoxygalactose transaminase